MSRSEVHCEHFPTTGHYAIGEKRKATVSHAHEQVPLTIGSPLQEQATSEHTSVRLE